jgi:tetratricopeptide (TPR) repeat protein
MISDPLPQAEAAERAAHYVEATELAQKALEHSRRDDAAVTEAHAHKLLGDVAARRGQPVKAREHYAAALHACRRGNIPLPSPATLSVEIYTLVAQADLVGRMGDTGEANAQLTLARQLVHSSDDTMWVTCTV